MGCGPSKKARIAQKKSREELIKTLHLDEDEKDSFFPDCGNGKVEQSDRVLSSFIVGFWLLFRFTISALRERCTSGTCDIFEIAT